MFDMMKKAQDMQKNLKLMQEELKSAEVTGQAAGGLVSVTISGTHEVKSVSIKPAAVEIENGKADVATLEDLVRVAFNDAVKQANAMAEAKVSKITGGIKIPGLLG